MKTYDNKILKQDKVNEALEYFKLHPLKTVNYSQVFLGLCKLTNGNVYPTYRTLEIDEIIKHLNK